MKKLLGTALVLLLLAAPAEAFIDQDPNYTFLWNGFSSVTVIDSFAVATTGEGLVVLKYDQLTKTYKAFDNIFLNSEPYRQKLTGNVLTIRTYADVLYFIDIGHLPDITLLGKIDIDFPFYDYALHGQDLYICAGFDGLLRYSMINYKMAAFADSSKTGIHYTRVEVYGNELYTLDDYNGILRYDVSGVGFGKFLDYLYIPFQATSFIKTDTTVIIASNRQKILLGHFGETPQVTDTVDLIIMPTRIFARDSLIIALDSSQTVTQVVNINDLTNPHIVVLEAPDRRLRGDFAVIKDQAYIIFPSPNFGLVLYELAEITVNPSPIIGFLRPGPVQDIAIYYGSLFTGGGNNPVDKYILSLDSRPTFRTTLYSGLNNVSSLFVSGDSLFIYYPKLGNAFILDISKFPISYEGLIPVDRDSVNKIIFQDKHIDTLRAFYAASPSGFDVYSVSDSNEVNLQASINILDQIFDFAVMDSLIVVSTNKSSIWVYRLYDNFQVEFRTTLGLPFNAFKIQPFNNHLLVFSSYQLIMFDLTDPEKARVDTSINIPIPVYDCTITNDKLYTVGPFGIGAYDLSSGRPRLLNYGGRSGHIIAAYDHIAAISDGNSIHMYDLRGALTDYTPVDDNLPSAFYLSQNYPNPFNPSTTIEYTLPRRSRVNLSIYNILGQHVTTLVDEEKSAGQYSVEWHGRAGDGRWAASGIYLYRLMVDDYSESKKMILLK